MFVLPQRPMNAARFIFLDPRAQTFYRDWEGNARQIVALLRAEAGRAPYDRILTDLVGELATRSDLFRTLWAAHDVREHRTGTKSIHHPVVGDLDLTFEAMDLTSDRACSCSPSPPHPAPRPTTDCSCSPTGQTQTAPNCLASQTPAAS